MVLKTPCDKLVFFTLPHGDPLQTPFASSFPLPAPPLDKDTVSQECRSFTRRREALGSISLAIQCELCLISLIVLPSNVPHMSILHKSKPFRARHVLNMDFSIRCLG